MHGRHAAMSAGMWGLVPSSGVWCMLSATQRMVAVRHADVVRQQDAARWGSTVRTSDLLAGRQTLRLHSLQLFLLMPTVARRLGSSRQTKFRLDRHSTTSASKPGWHVPRTSLARYCSQNTSLCPQPPLGIHVYCSSHAMDFPGLQLSCRPLAFSPVVGQRGR